MFLVVKFRCEETSDLPKINNYEVKISSENYDLPKASISGKTVNFNFPFYYFSTILVLKSQHSTVDVFL